jgi:hypothetical protein
MDYIRKTALSGSRLIIEILEFVGVSVVPRKSSALRIDPEPFVDIFENYKIGQNRDATNRIGF